MSGEARGHALKQRRLDLGMRGVATLERFMKEKAGSPTWPASHLDRATIKDVEDGVASEDSMSRVESWLDRIEEEIGAGADDEPSHPEGDQTVTLKLSGVYGVDEVVVSGPVHDLPALKESLADLIRELKGNEK